MKKTQEIFSIALGDEINAKISVSRLGQERPHVGDKVVVGLMIGLPIRKYPGLDPSLCFRDRVLVLGMPLTELWGRSLADFPGYRWNNVSIEVSATTWKKAFLFAQEKAVEIMKPLIDALEARKQALKNAEK